MKLAATFALLLLVASAAAQRASRPVALRVPDCLDVAGSAVRDLVALELAPRMHVVEPSAQPVLTGTVQCDQGAAQVVLSVEDPARAEPLRVELDLAAAAPLARPRLLALTLAELITTSQLEREPTVAPARSEPDAAQAELPDDRPSRSPALQLWVAPAFTVAASPATPLFGAELGVAPALGPVLLAFDLQARIGQNDRASSDVALRAFSAGVAVLPIVLDAGVQLSAGAGMRAGYLSLTGTSHRAELADGTVSGTWLGPMALAALLVPLGDALAARCALEAGYVARPLVGLDERGGERLALRGPWLSLSLGFALGVR